MNIGGVYELFSNLHNDNLSFIYQGSFNDEITERIIDISETNLLNKNEQHTISNKVSFLLAECFQNVVRHTENPALKQLSVENSGIFITRNIGNSYYITSANIINNKEKEELRIKLLEINNMTQEDLKFLYMHVLSNNAYTNKGGAGLGLIEMARKSGEKLDFDFETIDDEYSYFYFQIKLKSPGEVESKETAASVGVEVAKNFHRIMSHENIFIIHKGDFSQHTIIPILRMIEDNVYGSTDNTYSRKKIFHILVEILQNISKHAFEWNKVREAIFMMGRIENRFMVYTGNYILNSQIETLKEHLENLNSMTKQELSELYKLTLHIGTYTSKGGAGLGLIDVARDSSESIKYTFIPVDDEISFYSLGVVI
jgi:hypothetical protein